MRLKHPRAATAAGPTRTSRQKCPPRKGICRGGRINRCTVGPTRSLRPWDRPRFAEYAMHNGEARDQFVQLLTGRSAAAVQLPGHPAGRRPRRQQRAAGRERHACGRRPTTFRPGTNFLAWAREVAYYKALAFTRDRNRDKLIVNQELVEKALSRARVYGGRPAARGPATLLVRARRTSGRPVAPALQRRRCRSPRLPSKRTNQKPL